jgi:hypothetical protein
VIRWRGAVLLLRPRALRLVLCSWTCASRRRPVLLATGVAGHVTGHKARACSSCGDAAASHGKSRGQSIGWGRTGPGRERCAPPARHGAVLLLRPRALRLVLHSWTWASRAQAGAPGHGCGWACHRARPEKRGRTKLNRIGPDSGYTSEPMKLGVWGFAFQV